MILTLLFATAASAFTPGAPATSPYQQCVQSCIAWADQPGFELRRCVDECIRMQRERIINLDLNRKAEPRWCETYEDDCERPGTGI